MWIFAKSQNRNSSHIQIATCFWDTWPINQHNEKCILSLSTGATNTFLLKEHPNQQNHRHPLWRGRCATHGKTNTTTLPALSRTSTRPATRQRNVFPLRQPKNWHHILTHPHTCHIPGKKKTKYDANITPKWFKQWSHHRPRTILKWCQDYVSQEKHQRTHAFFQTLHKNTRPRDHAHVRKPKIERYLCEAQVHPSYATCKFRVVLQLPRSS